MTFGVFVFFFGNRVRLNLYERALQLISCHYGERLFAKTFVQEFISPHYTRDGSSVWVELGQRTIVRLIIRLRINTGKQTNHPSRRTIWIIRVHPDTILFYKDKKNFHLFLNSLSQKCSALNGPIYTRDGSYVCEITDSSYHIARPVFILDR